MKAKQRIYKVRHTCGNEQLLLMHDFSDKKHTNVMIYLKQECDECGELISDNPKPNYDIIEEIKKKNAQADRDTGEQED